MGSFSPDNHSYRSLTSFESSAPEYPNALPPGTVLNVAEKKGYTELVRLLLAAPGIDVNKADAFGRTARFFCGMVSVLSSDTQSLAARLLLAVRFLFLCLKRRVFVNVKPTGLLLVAHFFK